MKTHQNRLIVVILCVLIVSCSIAPKSDTAIITSVQDQLHEIEIEPSYTVTPKIPTPNSDQAYVKEVTPLPTLSDIDQEAYLLDLIQTNGGCDLPCWWGIHPGVSTWLDLRSILGSLGLFQDISVATKDGSYETIISVGMDRDKAIANLHLNFSGPEDIIEHIYIAAENSYPATS